MRFARIEVPAFGPFTRLDIDFPKTGTDLHLFHGANEAGKSSLLRCLRSFLFGIDTQTPDNFLHPYGSLLIIGDLERNDGTATRFKRRKGSKNTLLDADDAPLSETSLATYLGGVDRNYFESMFGMGSQELQAGAENLLRGHGRLGEALFSASLGGTPVDRVIAALENEANELFRARGNATIRTGRRQLDDCLRQSRDLLMKPDLWEEAVRTIDELEGQIQRANESKIGLVTRRAWLERCRDALPITGQYRQLIREIAEMEGIPALRTGFAEEITKALESWTNSQARQAPLGAAIATLRTDLEKTELSPEVLAEKIEIHRLHSALELHREQKLNRATKKLEASQRERRIDARRAELGIKSPVSELNAHRLSQPELLETQQAAKELAAAQRQLESSESYLENLKQEIARLNDEILSPIGDIAALESVVARTQKFEDVARGLAGRILKSESARKTAENLLRQLPGAGDAPASVRKLSPPLRSAIEKFRDDFDQLARTLQGHRDVRAKALARISELDAEIQRSQRQKHLPTGDDLRRARLERDRLWDAVLQEWKGTGAKGITGDGKPLDSVYPETVQVADDIADRLLSDAEAVAQFEQKRTEREVQQSLVEEADRSLLAVEGDLTALKSEWSAAWQPSAIQPSDPKVMTEWRTLWEEFSRIWDRWDEDHRQLESDRSDLATATAELSAALGGQAGELPDLLAAATSKISSHNQALGASREVNRQLALKQQAVEQTEGVFPTQQQAAKLAADKWNECCTRYGLSTRLNPADSLSVLQERVTLFHDFDRWLEIVSEVEDLDRSIQSFEENVRSLATRLGRISGEIETVLSSLWQECRRGEAAAERAETLQSQLEARLAEETALAAEVSSARTVLDQMLKEASLPDEQAVPDFVEKFNTKRAKSEEIAIRRHSLAALARDQELDSFVEKVEAEGGDQIEGALESVGREIADLERDQEQLRAGLQEWRGKRQIMENASDAAAQALQQAELAVSSLRRDAERFAKLQLGIVTLKSRIDRFRKQNQGPFMDKAGRWFAEITSGAFAGLSTHFGDGDQPAIAGMRNEGAILTVEQMSTGTRDQLYLALRLAGLELHLADNEPMPLILDDLLVQFDDRRSIQTIKALAQFSRQSQILLFTHHEHLVELAQKHLGPDGFHLHRLPKEAAEMASPA